MVFNWFKGSDPAQALQEARRKVLLDGAEECMEISCFLRTNSRALRSEIVDELVRRTTARDPAIEEKMQSVKGGIESIKARTAANDSKPGDMSGELGAVLQASKTMKGMANDIAAMGSRTRSRLYSDCPNGRLFLSIVKDSLNKHAKVFGDKICSEPSEMPREGIVTSTEVEDHTKRVTLKQLTEKHMSGRIDRYRRALSSQEFFLPVSAGLKERFSEIDRTPVKVPQNAAPALMQRNAKGNDSEMRRAEDAIQKLTDSKGGIIGEINELRCADESCMQRRDRIALEQRLAALEKTAKEKEEQLKKADERLKKIRWKNDHLDESNERIDGENAAILKRYCAELENSYAHLVTAYNAKCESISGLLAEIAEDVKRSRYRVVPLARLRESVVKIHERKKAEMTDERGMLRFKLFLESKTIDELKTAYKTIEGERIVRFSQAMVLMDAAKAGGIDKLIGYGQEDALIDVLKARSRGVPRKAIKEFVKNNPPPGFE